MRDDSGITSGQAFPVVCAAIVLAQVSAYELVSLCEFQWPYNKVIHVKLIYTGSMSNGTTVFDAYESASRRRD